MAKVLSRLIMALVCAVICLSGCRSAQVTVQPQKEAARLYPIMVSGKCGYIDAQGRIAIEPQFGPDCQFSEGRARYVIGGRYGFMDETGRCVITPRFDRVEGFSGGLARVALDLRTLYVDKAGRTVIDLGRVCYAGDFSEGLAPLKPTIGGPYGYIDRTGKRVIPPRFDAAGNFHEGLAAVESGGKLGYIDKTGRMAVKPQYALTDADDAQDTDYAPNDFSDGVAVVGCIVGGHLKCGCIDKTGKLVIPARFDWIGKYSQGRACIRVGVKYGYIDKDGAIVIEPQFLKAYRFSEGLARVLIGNERYARFGFIDCAGQIVINPKFERARDFKGDLALVQTDETIGYINKSGKYVWSTSDGSVFEWSML
jgi:hypothetical protein